MLNNLLRMIRGKSRIIIGNVSKMNMELCRIFSSQQRSAEKRLFIHESQGIIGRYSEVNAYVKWRVILACVLRSLNYGTQCLLPLYNKTALKKWKSATKKALKRVAGLLISFPTDDLWQVKNEKPFPERIRQLHRDGLEKLQACPYLRGLTPDNRRPYNNPAAKINILSPTT